MFNIMIFDLNVIIEVFGIVNFILNFYILLVFILNK